MHPQTGNIQIDIFSRIYREAGSAGSTGGPPRGSPRRPRTLTAVWTSKASDVDADVGGRLPFLHLNDLAFEHVACAELHGDLLPWGLRKRTVCLPRRSRATGAEQGLQAKLAGI